MTFIALVGILHDRSRLCRLRRPTRAGIGRSDSPVFSHCDPRRGQIARRRLRSGHRGRPGRRGGHAEADCADLSRPWRDRRGIWPRSPGGGICVGARSDRRHQEFHLRPADLGHPDRTDASRPAGLRHDGAAIHPRAVLRRRQSGETAHALALARRGAAIRMDDAGAARSFVRFLERSDPDDDEPAADFGTRPTGRPTPGSKTRSA